MCSKSACEQVIKDVLPSVNAALKEKCPKARVYVDGQHPSVMYLELPGIGVFEMNVWDLTPERFRRDKDRESIGPDTWYYTQVNGQRIVYQIEKPEDMNNQKLQLEQLQKPMKKG